jgi:hypothetical protein
VSASVLATPGPQGRRACRGHVSGEQERGDAEVARRALALLAGTLQVAFVACLRLVIAEVERVVRARLLVVDVAGIGALLLLEQLDEHERASLWDVEYTPGDDIGRRLGLGRLGHGC